MKSLLSYALVTLLLCAGKNVVHAQDQDTIWEKVKSEPYSTFKKYEGEHGSHRTPLKFYDGRMVKTRADWKNRRKEIVNRWQKMMGPWPKLVTKPEVEIIETTHWENFTQ